MPFRPYNRKWMTITGLVVIACAVGWWHYSSSSGPGSAFSSTPAFSDPYSLGDPGDVTPAKGSSFEIRRDGSGEPVAVSGDATSSGTHVYLASARINRSGTAETPAYPPGSVSAPPAAPPAGSTGGDGNGYGSGNNNGDGQKMEIPPFLPANLFKPLPGAKTRGVAISEWESYRTDVAGKNILVTTDDSNVFKNRNGKLNGNTGDTDASGLNVTDATDATILGTESADEAPWQTVAQAIVDIHNGSSGANDEGAGGESDDDGDANDPDPGANPEDSAQTSATAAGNPRATAAVFAAPNASDETPDQPDPDSDDGTDDGTGGFDFPYLEWLDHISAKSASSVHTDEGTTLASGADALVIGGDGFDDDDNRAAGQNIVIARDDCHIVLGGKGDVNAQIGDSEQGAVIMNVKRVLIKGGGAY